MTEPPARIYYFTFAKKISFDDLQGSFFVPEGLPQPLNVLLLVVNLLHGLAQVGLKLVMRVRGLLRLINSNESQKMRIRRSVLPLSVVGFAITAKYIPKNP